MRRRTLCLLFAAILVLGSFGMAFADQSYTVKSGDVLWKIAQSYGTTYQKLADYNKIANPHLIYPGQIIRIPGSDTAANNNAPPAMPAVPAANAADTVLMNATVYTIDASNTVAEAIALKDGKIAFVGSNDGAKAFIGPNTQAVDLKGKVVMPGMIDSHVHPPGVALTELYSINLYVDVTREGTLKIIKDYIEANPDLQEYWGTGYTVGIGESGKGPRREWLDAICSDKPIILTSNDGHNMWMNTKAFEMNGITKDTPVPEGGLVHLDPSTGELWGSLTDAQTLVTMEQTFSDDQMVKAMDAFQDQMHAWGYTGIISVSGKSVFEQLLPLEKAGKLKLRANTSYQFKSGNSAMAGETDMTFEKELSEAKALRAQQTDRLRLTTAKFFADGVVEGSTAYLTEPYAVSDDPGYKGMLYYDMDELERQFSAVLKDGFQIHVHSIGDAATQSVLDALEYAQKADGNTGYRNAITHLQLVREQDIPRFAELGVIATVQPFWHMKEPYWWSDVEYILIGEDRAYHEYPLQSFFKNGVTVTSSGDHPVSPVNNPFWAIEAGVTRNLENAEFYGVDDITDIDDPTWLLDPEERASVLDMVKAYTINGAYAQFREKENGSLEKGKYADLIVVDKDIFKVDPLAIDSIQVLATVFNGEVVYGELK